jgi:glycerol kinase
VSGLLLGLDQGTSSTRCVAVDADLRERGAASVAVACAYPGAGRVEQDPGELVESARAAVAGAIACAGARAGDVIALGIANQTETFVLWERATGRPVHPAIVWQDRRTDAACAALAEQGRGALVRERTGLELDATFPATKIGWVLDHAGGVRAAAEAGELAYGDVASWLLHALGGVHVGDVGNASRSGLWPLAGGDWDDELLELFGIPRALLPQVVDSDGLDVAAAIAPGAEVPVRAAAGDQQASLFGLRCWAPGAAKVTLGSGAFVLVHAGWGPPRPPPGVLASCAWRRAGETTYALEGFVPTAGSAADWFGRIGAIDSGPELDALLGDARRDDSGLVCVPALQGFGTPGWDAGARGALLGVRLETTRADIAQAVVDGILHQVVDALEAIAATVEIRTLRLDGGLSRSDRVVQRLADLAGVPVERTTQPDSTALGAAMLAGLAAGAWDGPAALPPELSSAPPVAEPSLQRAEREDRRERWADACRLVASRRS